MGLLAFLPFLAINAQIDSVELVYQWADETIPGSAAYDNAYNEVWGFTVGDHEFGVIGTTMGTHIFDLDAPNIDQVAFFEGKVTGTSIIHRDYHDNRGYLYHVSDEGGQNQGLQIFDVSGLPDTVFLAYESSEHFSTSHNIFIDQGSDLLYVCGGVDYTNFDSFKLRVYDISNPLELDFKYQHETFSAHDVYVENDTAVLHCGGQGMYFYDFEDPTNPELIGVLSSYPTEGYNHSGWMSEDGSHYFLADETWGSPMKSLNIEDYSDIQIASFFGPEEEPNNIPHNLMVRGNYLFASYYYDGVLVYDITDAANPELVRAYGTSNIAHQANYQGAWGVYSLLPSGRILVSDMQEGFFVFDMNLDFTMEIDTMVIDSMIVDTMMVDSIGTSIGNLTFLDKAILYPTRVNDRINITGALFNRIRLYDLSGKLLKEEGLNVNAISDPYSFTLPNLKSAVYLIEISDGAQRKVFKIVKK